MSSSGRITRPQVTRSEPIRSFRGTADARPPEGPAGAQAPRPGVGDAIATAVDLGYRVLDEYLQQGQSAARRLGVRPDRTEAAVDDLQALATRMARYTSDFLGVWAQFVEVALTAGGLGGPRTTPTAGANGTSPSPPPAVRAAVAVRVASVQPAEIVADVTADMVGRGLTVQALRSPDPAVPPLTDVRFAPATTARPARVDVIVPPQQPPGTYVGVVVDDETGRFAGTVTVTITAGEA